MAWHSTTIHSNSRYIKKRKKAEVCFHTSAFHIINYFAEFIKALTNF